MPVTASASIRGCIPERIDDPAAADIEWIVDFYDERYTHLDADVVICRHTLEHIPDVADFMSTIRRSIGDRPDTVVLFELPDVQRVLDEVAFWDIYYEHCSYFSLGSLARLFRRTGFEVLELSLEYDDQYLLIAARPSTRAGSRRAAPRGGRPRPAARRRRPLPRRLRRAGRRLARADRTSDRRWWARE